MLKFTDLSIKLFKKAKVGEAMKILNVVASENSLNIKIQREFKISEKDLFNRIKNN